MAARTAIPISTRPRRPTFAARAAAAFLVLLTVLAALPAWAEPLTWIPAERAMLRVDDAPPKEWDVFHIEKKADRFLVQLGGRYLLVDVQPQQVFDLDPATVQRQGPDLLWDPQDRPEKPMATSEWVVRDVGMAFRIKFRLDAEGRVLDLQLPHPNSRP